MSLIAENVRFMPVAAINTAVMVLKFASSTSFQMQWLDPSTFRVMFTIHNNNPASPPIKVKPLHWNPAVLFRRCRVICGGVVIEDIDDFNRLSLMLTAMKPVDEQKDIAIQGFGLFDRVNDLDDAVATDWNTGRDSLEDSDERKAYRANDWDEASEIKTQRTVLFKPLLGILDQEKLIPLRYAPLQFEFELVSNSADCMFVGPNKNVNCNENWSLSDIQCKMDLLTLDSSPFRTSMLLICFQVRLYRLISAVIITHRRLRIVTKILVLISIVPLLA